MNEQSLISMDGDEETSELRPQNAMVESKKAEAVSQIQAMHVMAKRFPRDEINSETRIVQSCKRYSLAEKASYRFPRGGQSVSGPSIRLAEMLAQYWGNLRYGFQEIEQRADGTSVVESFCHDMESNTLVSRVFTVSHKIMLKSGKEKILTDPRDVYELVANQAQRRTRAAILATIPGDVVEKAVRMCQKTLAAGEKSIPLIDRVKVMVTCFAEMSINKEMLEKRMGHAVDLATPEEVAEYTQIYNSLQDKMTKRSDWFDLPQATSEGGKAAELSARMNAKNEKKNEPAEVKLPIKQEVGDFGDFQETALPKGKT